jgi:hypothetical protein
MQLVIPVKPGIYFTVGFNGFRLSAGSKQRIERFENFEGMLQ